MSEGCSSILSSMPLSPEAKDEALVGDVGTSVSWGLWERLAPLSVHPEDTAGQRLLAQHLKRYEEVAEQCRAKRVLDISCGLGYGTKMIADRGAKKVLGVDISPAAIGYATKHYNCSNLEFQIANAECFTSSHSFDFCVTFETIEHLNAPKAFLACMYSLLESDGQLYLSVPLGETRYFDPYHLHAFSLEEILFMLREVGFSILRYRVEPWLAEAREILAWRKYYPACQPSIWQLLWQARGRGLLKQYFWLGGIPLPSLFVVAQKITAQ